MRNGKEGVDTHRYDRYGNITGIVDGTTPYAFNVDPATNRLLSRMGSGGQTSFSYDNAGNATSYGPFDAENRLRSRAGTNYLYDGNGQRFRRQGSSTVNYIYSHSGVLLQEDNVTSGAKDDFIYFNGQNVVVHGQNPTAYKVMLRDYHGSVRKSALVTFSSPGLLSISLCEQYAYDPWGQVISSVQSNPPYTDFKYENKERDGGLDYFGARYNDGSNPSAASAMRWISPDPVTSKIYDPQSLNKYTYVRNDPVNLVDPDGRFAVPKMPYDDGGGIFQSQGPMFFYNVEGTPIPNPIYNPLPTGGGSVNPGGGGGGSACNRTNANNAKKLDWIRDHRKDAQKVADELHTNVENILGLSALESGWGKGPFVINGGNNFFGMHYDAKHPPALSTGPIPGHKVQMAQYASYADSAQSFALSKGGRLVTDITDATTFAKKLQDAGLYGIDPDTGKKVKSYVGDVVGTISGIASRLNCEK